MAKTVAMAGIDSSELRWLRLLLVLLRHSDPAVPELARHALIYLAEAAQRRTEPSIKPLDDTG